MKNDNDKVSIKELSIGYTMLALVTRLVHDCYTINSLIINAGTRFTRFPLYFLGDVKIFEKNVYIERVGKGSHRVTKFKNG